MALKLNAYKNFIENSSVTLKNKLELSTQFGRLEFGISRQFHFRCQQFLEVPTLRSSDLRKYLCFCIFSDNWGWRHEEVTSAFCSCWPTTLVFFIFIPWWVRILLNFSQQAPSSLLHQIGVFIHFDRWAVALTPECSQ